MTLTHSRPPPLLLTQADEDGVSAGSWTWGAPWGDALTDHEAAPPDTHPQETLTTILILVSCPQPPRREGWWGGAPSVTLRRRRGGTSTTTTTCHLTPGGGGWTPQLLRHWNKNFKCFLYVPSIYSQKSSENHSRPRKRIRYLIHSNFLNKLSRPDVINLNLRIFSLPSSVSAGVGWFTWDDSIQVCGRWSCDDRQYEL